jgi:DNA-binding HxlR family transcriptional regulator
VSTFGQQPARPGLAQAAALLARPWTLLILDRLAAQPRRFTELVAELPGISSNLLADRLRTLSEAGVIERTPTPTSTSYGLTEAGRQLQPTLVALADWGARYLADDEVST